MQRAEGKGCISCAGMFTRHVQIQFTANCLQGLSALVDGFEQLTRLSLWLTNKHDIDV